MRFILFILLTSVTLSQTWVKTASGSFVKLGSSTLQGDSVVIQASATVDSSIYASKSFVLNQYIPRFSATIGSKPNVHLGANGVLYKSTDTSSSGGGIPYSDTTSVIAMQWELDGKQNKYANITDTSAYMKKSDSTTLFAGKLGGWTELQLTADTATGTFTFVNLGGLQFTMTASGVYEIEARIYMNRSTAANGYTIALNCGGTPTNVGIIGESPASTTAGTDMMRTEPITTGTDSLQQAGTTVTTTEYATFKGILTCDGSNRLFTFRVRSEVSASAITYKRGSWLRYRRLY